MLLLTLRGTPFIYYGEEIGMEDVAIPEERAQDPARFAGPNRDPERTPMPWNAEAGRGFTTGEPWLPFGEAEINVAAQQDDPVSLLSLYRRLIWFRRHSDALRFGDYRPVEVEPDQIVAYLRESDDERLLILLNFGIEPVEVVLPEGVAPSGLAVSTQPDRTATTVIDGPIRLADLEGMILTLA
jgi:alpha-glucosidase